jgi:hypothetical protein
LEKGIGCGSSVVVRYDARTMRLLTSLIPILSAPGTYRAEILLDEKPMWRGFVAVTP